MRNSSIVIGIMLSIIFFITGYTTYEYFFMWVLPAADHVQYITTSMASPFIPMLMYGIALGLIPLSIVLVWKLAAIVSIKRRTFAAFLIIAGVFFAGFTRYLVISNLAGKTSKPGNEYQYGIPVSKVNIEIYMIIGVAAGSVIAYFLFRPKKNKPAELSF